MIFKSLQASLDAFRDRDPAARSRLEVALCYPGFHALVIHRLAHALWRRRFRVLGRFVSQIGRWMTGIEIHPGARIGQRFVIDHGSGVVIGETSEIGDDVTLYQGVTLGGVAPAVDSRSQVDQKRHPTLANGVIVGAGAQVLGPITVGENARVGSNAVVTRDVPPGVTAAGIPARIIMPRDKSKEKAKEFMAYGTPIDDLFDPVLRNMDSLRGQMAVMAERIEELETRLAEREVAGETDRTGPKDAGHRGTTRRRRFDVA